MDLIFCVFMLPIPIRINSYAALSSSPNLSNDLEQAKLLHLWGMKEDSCIHSWDKAVKEEQTGRKLDNLCWLGIELCTVNGRERWQVLIATKGLSLCSTLEILANTKNTKNKQCNSLTLLLQNAPLLSIESEIAQSCPTLCDPRDYTVYGILQARILEWVAIPFSRSSQLRDQTQVSCIAGWLFTSWATREVPLYLLFIDVYLRSVS